MRTPRRKGVGGNNQFRRERGDYHPVCLEEQKNKVKMLLELTLLILQIRGGMPVQWVADWCTEPNSITEKLN